ncbi:MAG: hypothetical protein JWR52_1055 [Marmoricola sp.]|nr:hypothetical protein [Marmoricola sp.]
MSGPQSAVGCPAWCVQDHWREGSPPRHVGERVALARSEDGVGAFTACLAATESGTACDVLIESWIRHERQVSLPVGALDMILDAFDDGGSAAVQRLAGLVVQASNESEPRKPLN